MAIVRPTAFRRALLSTGLQKNRPTKMRRIRERFHQLESLEERVITAADVAANVIEVATSAIVGPLILSSAVQGERDVSADQQTVEEALSPADVDEVMLDGEVDSSHTAVVESVGDSAANGEAIDPQDFRASLDELLSQYQSETEQVEQEAQLQRQAVLGAAEHQAAQLLDDQQAQLQRAEQDRVMAVDQANRNAEAEVARAEQARVAAIAAAQQTASQRIAEEAAKRDATINTQTREANYQITSQARTRDTAVAQHQASASRQLNTAQNNAVQQSNQATAQRDAEIRDARSWADRAISNLPRWARGLARFLRPIFNTLENAVNRVTAAAQNTLRQIQSSLQTLTRNILQARDQLVASARSAYDSAVRGILATRDRVVAAARTTFSNISNALVATRDRIIATANDTAVAIRSGAERAREVTATNAENLLQSTRTAIVESGRDSLARLESQTQTVLSQIENQTVEKATGIWVTTRNEIGRVGQGLVTYAARTVQSVGTFAEGTFEGIVSAGNEMAERISTASTPRDIGVAAWLFVRDVTTSTVQQGGTALLQQQANHLIHLATTVVDAIVPDVVMRELMQGNLSWYVDQNAAATAVVNSHLGGAPLYYINGVDTDLQGDNYLDPNQDLIQDSGALEQAEGLSLRLGRAVQVVWNRTNGVPLDFTEALADRLWHPILPQHNPATKAIAGILLDHARRNEPVSIVAHSQGNIILRNALRTLYHLGFENWVRDQVRWVGAGSPVAHGDVEFSVHYTRIVNEGDVINVVAEYQQFREAGRDGRPFGMDEHTMVTSYVSAIDSKYLWSSGAHQAGTMPQGVDSTRFALHADLWAAREGLEPFVTHHWIPFA